MRIGMDILTFMEHEHMDFGNASICVTPIALVPGTSHTMARLVFMRGRMVNISLASYSGDENRIKQPFILDDNDVTSMV
jgi:hypothetical protein